MVRSRGLKKIVLLMLKNKVGGEDGINGGWPGSAPPPHWSKTGLAFSSWGVCVAVCTPVCVQNMDGRHGLPLGSAVTSGKPQSAHLGVERTASGVLSEPTQGSAFLLAVAAPSLLRSPSQTLPSPQDMQKSELSASIPSAVPAQSGYLFIYLF